MPMIGQHNFFDFRRWLTNIWLCRLRGVFSTKRPKYLGKSADNIPTHMNLLWNGIYFILLKCIPPLNFNVATPSSSFNTSLSLSLAVGWFHMKALKKKTRFFFWISCQKKSKIFDILVQKTFNFFSFLFLLSYNKKNSKFSHFIVLNGKFWF